MKRCLLFILISLLSVTALKAQSNKAAIQLNDNLAAITDSLYSGGKRWGDEFNKSYASGDYSRMHVITDELLGYVNKKTADLQKMKDVKNSKPLRMAMLDFLIFEKKMITEGFRPFEVFDSTSSKEKVQAALDNLREKSKDENSYLQKVGEAQKAYASENGFKVE